MVWVRVFLTVRGKWRDPDKIAWFGFDAHLFAIVVENEGRMTGNDVDRSLGNTVVVVGRAAPAATCVRPIQMCSAPTRWPEMASKRNMPGD